MSKEQKESKVKNCAACGKPTKRIKRYYRNSKFYCNKRCYKNAKSKEQKKG